MKFIGLSCRIWVKLHSLVLLKFYEILQLVHNAINCMELKQQSRGKFHKNLSGSRVAKSDIIPRNFIGFHEILAGARMHFAAYGRFAIVIARNSGRRS